MNKEDLKKNIDNVFSADGAGWYFRDRMNELNTIFTAQLSSLDKVRKLGFFTNLTEKFWDALAMFLDLAKNIRSEYTDYLIRESYTFIKSFDNALQGYLNSDRQFLEFPGHSVSLYDLPAKLGGVYTQYIDIIIDSIKDDSSDKVTYLLCPEPFDEEGVHVTRLLADNSSDTNTHSYLLIIESPAKLMFQPDKLLFALSHEIAHYIGRKHRVYNKELGIERNKVLFDLHKKAIADECVFSLKERLESIYDASPDENLLIAINKCEERFLSNDSSIVSHFENEEYAPNDMEFLSQVEVRLKKHFARVPSPTINELMLQEFERANVGLRGRSKLLFERNKQVIIEDVKSRMISLHENAMYIVREGTADVLAIKLLNVEEEEYRRIMENEKEKVLTNDNILVALPLRESIVCSACFETQLCETCLGEEVDALLVSLLTKIYNAFSVAEDNEVRKFYDKAVKKSTPYDLIATHL